MKIVAHCLARNEAKFIWYAINSVIDTVDEILVWDQGSSDQTREIIKTIKNPKIKFKEVGGSVTLARQKMLNESQGFEWIFILDGDEIWFESSIEYLVSSIESSFDCVVIPNYMLIGDIFHYQEEMAGRYQIAGRIGHYNIRFIRTDIPGLHIEGVYPNEAYVNKHGIKVQDLPKERILFFDKPYLHASFLKKRKYEIGESFPRDFYFPEVFFRPRPAIVPSPWTPMTLGYKLNAFWRTPLKKIKRRLL